MMTMVMHMKMPPRAARAMPIASTAYRDAEPDRSMLGKAALMFLMHAPPVVVLHHTWHAFTSKQGVHAFAQCAAQGQSQYPGELSEQSRVV